MTSSGKSPKDYLDLATNPFTSASELGVLANSGYDFVLLAVINNPNVTAHILNKCIPVALTTGAQRKLAAAIARHPLASAHALDALTDMVAEIQFCDVLHDACMHICIHSNSRDRNIKKIITARGANSAFRNDLWQFCQNTSKEAFIRSKLKEVKERNKALRPDVNHSELQDTQSSMIGVTPTSSFDALTGKWVYEEFYSGGHTELHMLLGANGICLYSSGSRMSLTLQDSMGHWQGSAELASGVRPGERGRWHCSDNLLTLEMEDDTIIEYKIAFDSGLLITTHAANHSRKVWTKEA